mmetsp:Transcript_33426/g.40956  ORF Transcript_33426/g.40956 Transcript_33426/m.40956 type:complete len:130 (+) Transcript_33426:1306-1695(+)
MTSRGKLVRKPLYMGRLSSFFVYRHTPPGSLSFSNTVTLPTPFRVRARAVARPAAPAPITATFIPDAAFPTIEFGLVALTFVLEEYFLVDFGIVWELMLAKEWTSDKGDGVNGSRRVSPLHPDFVLICD